MASHYYFLIILTGCFLSPSKIENMSSTILFDFTTENVEIFCYSLPYFFVPLNTL